MEAQRTELSRRKMEARSRLTALAWELLGVQKEHDKLDKKLEVIHRKQEEMVDQEARSLGELDTFVGLDDPSVAMMSDVDFSWEGVALELGEPDLVGDILGQIPG